MMYDHHRFAIDGAGVVRWLIWIQLLVFFLLLLLFSYFGVAAVDDLSRMTAAAFSSVPGGGGAVVGGCRRRRSGSVEEDGNEYMAGVAGQRIASTNSSRTTQAENRTERDDSSTCGIDDSESLNHPYHPCRIFELAGRVFLGCLGIASAPSSPSSQDNEEDDNS